MHRASQPAESRRSGFGFTLIELLVVVSIMGLLLALTVPAFMDIGRGSRMQGSVSQLSSTFSLARQMAITQRDYITVLFPDDWLQMYSGLGTNHYDKALRSYAVYSPQKGYVTEWRYLPEGVFFVDTQNAQNPFVNNENRDKVDAANNVFSSSYLTNLPFPTATSPRKTLPGITFGPDGKVRRQGVQPIELYFAEGIRLEGSAGKAVNVAWRENPVLMGVKIRPFTSTMQYVDFTQLD